MRGDNSKTPLTWEESDWISFAHVSIPSGKLWVGDPEYVPDPSNGKVVEVTPGVYECFIKKIVFSDGEERAMRLRASLVGTSPDLGEQIGETWADTAAQAVCDSEQFAEALKEEDAFGDEAEYREGIWEGLSEGRLGGYWEYNPDAGLAFCSSGWGDGRFKLFELMEGGQRRGVEVEMIDSNDPLPSS